MPGVPQPTHDPGADGVEPDPANLRCDMPVQVVFEDITDEITLPKFRPVAGAAT